MTIKKWTYAVGLAAGFALVACTGENGQDGAPGADGTSCVAKALKDSTGFEILCGDDVVGTIKNGEDGEDGKKGDKGDKGEKGDTGKKGDKGDAGENGASCTVKPMEPSGFKVICDGDSVGVLVNGVDGDAGADGKSAYELAVAAGFEGDSAAWLAALKGDQGVKGDTGVAGADGKSAYELAVAAGFEGDSAAWLASLKGDKGDQGVKGDTGVAGKSAYELAVAAGFEGTEADWRAALKGDKGDKGDNCTLKDNEDGTVTVTCGKDVDPVTLYKAMCGTSSYDPGVQFCTDAKKVYPLCRKQQKDATDLNADGTYDVAAFFCDANDSLVALCGGESYNTAAQFCFAGTTYPRCHSVTQLGDHNAVEGDALAGDGTYDVGAFFCAANDSLYKLCEGTDAYNPELQYCDATKGVQALCGGKSYDLATQMCVEGKVDTAWACCQRPGMGAAWCEDNANWYDVRDEFCDTRDGIHYKFVTIAKKGLPGEGYFATWMAENLKYSVGQQAGEGYCRSGDATCETYGRYYSWNYAKYACLDGWHLPTQAEYQSLVAAFGTSANAYTAGGITGFDAKPAGYSANGTSVASTAYAYFWMATENEGDDNRAYVFRIYPTGSVEATSFSYNKAYFLNVRCVKD